MPIPIQVSVERAVFHTNFTAKCNGKQYPVPIPNTNFNFIQIASEITFRNEYEKYLAVLSGTANEVDSIDQYYEFQEFSHKYFNLKVQMNWDDLALKILADKDSIFVDLDRMHFKDLLLVFKKAYNAFADKLHSKVNRRIKSYIKATNRTESEKNQISQLITLIKADSTEQEFSDDQKKLVSIKPAAKYKQKQKPFAKKLEQVEPIQQKSLQKKLVPEKEQNSVTESKEKINQDDNDGWTHHAKINKKDHPNFYKTTHHQKRQKNREHPKKQEDDQNDWEDVKSEKINKRQDKNLKKKHEKYDLSDLKLSHEAEDDEEEEPVQVQIQRQQRKPRKKYVKEDNRGNYDPKPLFSNSKQKPKKEMRILLGINGDSDDGWRDRYRVARSPVKTEAKPEKQEAKKYKYKQNSPQSKPIIQNSPQVATQAQNVAAESKVIRLESGSKQLVKVFSFPKDGKKFILDASKQYKLHVNNTFWVMLQKDKMTVQKQEKGYLRDYKFRSSDDYLLEAQDLTLSLNGLSNLEDGGTQFNNPIAEDFTGPSQWFHVTQLQIYAYE